MAASDLPLDLSADEDVYPEGGLLEYIRTNVVEVGGLTQAMLDTFFESGWRDVYTNQFECDVALGMPA
jgi:hypothetical protein